MKKNLLAISVLALLMMLGCNSNKQDDSIDGIFIAIHSPQWIDWRYRHYATTLHYFDVQDNMLEKMIIISAEEHSQQRVFKNLVVKGILLPGSRFQLESGTIDGHLSFQFLTIFYHRLDRPTTYRLSLDKK
jgi:hypothetical protein